MTGLIGLMGQKRSGKDTVAAALVEKGYQRFAFADPMKEALLAINPAIGRDGSNAIRLDSIIEQRGWESAKEIREVRRLLQEFGGAIRAIQSDFWVTATMNPARWALHRGKSVVITDVRFPNEAQAIIEAGGTLIRVDRPGLPDDDRHASEHAWRNIPPDWVIDNDSTIEALHEKVAVLTAA